MRKQETHSEGSDGVVFVADSQIERMEANIESLDDLRINLAEQGMSLTNFLHGPAQQA